MDASAVGQSLSDRYLRGTVVVYGGGFPTWATVLIAIGSFIVLSLCCTCCSACAKWAEDDDAASPGGGDGHVAPIEEGPPTEAKTYQQKIKEKKEAKKLEEKSPP